MTHAIQKAMRPNLLGRLLVACLCFLVSSASAQANDVAPPKLVVALVVDQFGYDLFERYEDTFTGGLGRIKKGIVFTGYQSHAGTETCPGHSTILTGDHPNHTGIVANSWYEQKGGYQLYCVRLPGIADPAARGPALLKVDTLGDWLKAASPGSKSFSVSAKDRAAIMLGGQHPDGAFWWDDGIGFSTYRPNGPPETPETDAAKAFNAALMNEWRKKAPKLWPARAPKQCPASQRLYHVDQGVMGPVDLDVGMPPESALEAERDAKRSLDSTLFQQELRVSPLIDDLTLAFAEKLVDLDQLGSRDTTDLLAISLSATDTVGHRFGNGSRATCTQLAQLDQALGKFFDHLDALGRPYIVVLTADHGGIDAPERLGQPAERIDGGAIMAELGSYLRKTYALQYDPILSTDPRQIVLGLAPLDGKHRAEIVASALKWLKNRKEVAAAFSAQEIAASAPSPHKRPTQLSVPERFYLSYDKERSGDIFVAYSEFSTIGMPQTSTSTVAGHGSPWDYDRRVPIAFWWPGITPAQRGEPFDTVDIAPTLASFIGVKPPKIDGECVDIAHNCPLR